MLRSAWILLLIAFAPTVIFAQDENSVLTRLHPRPQVSWLRTDGSFVIVPQVRIIVSDSASDGTRKAVSYLQKLIEQAVGDTLLILPESMNDKMPAIYVGTVQDFPTLVRLAQQRMVHGETLSRAESYLIDSQPLMTILLGSDSSGVFDAVSTLAQFFIGPSLHTAIPSLHILDWPDYPVRWVFSQHNLQVAANVDALASIQDTMAFHKLNGLQQNDFKYNRLESVPDWYFTNVDSLRRHSNRTNVEIIPGVAPIGYSEGILLHDPDLAEGFETNAQFVIEGDGGRLITDPKVELANGGFEGHNGDTFIGFGYQDAPGERTFADNTVHHSGGVSMKCTNMTGGNTRVIKTLPCKPNRGYRLSVWAKTSNFRGYFQLLAIGINSKGVSQTLTFTQYDVPASGDWQQYNVVFNTLGNEQVNVYAGVWGDAEGTIWLDDFAIEDAGLTNIVRRATTQPSVTVLHKTENYVESRDYAPLIDSVMESASGNYTWHTGPTFRLLPSTTLHWGDTVNVHFWRANPVLNYNDGNGSTMVCVSEDTLYSILHDQISRVEQLLHPEQYMLGHDEIRALNQDSACRRRNLSAAQLLADNLTKCDSIVHVVSPDAPTYVWSDMFDSLHNAHPNYYLINGDLSGDWDLIPKDITIVNWNGKKSESLKFFADKGFRQIASPYYDVPDTRNMREWRIAMEGVPNIAGMMYTTWSADYRYLTPFADYAWSAGPMIVHRPFDSVAMAAFGEGQYLFVDAYVYSDPYDNADAIDSVVYREHSWSSGREVVRELRMQNDSGARWRAATLIQTDTGTDITYEIIAKNKQGISRTTPTYLLFHRSAQQRVRPARTSTYSLYPNPAANRVTLRGQKDAVVIEIVNATGIVIRRETLDPLTHAVDVHALSNGAYTLHFPFSEAEDLPFVILH